MKTSPRSFTALFAAALFFTSVGHADEAAYRLIVEERDSVLSQILAEREMRYSSGTADEKIVSEARLALYSFRRDTATVIGEKVRHQELIVRMFEEKLERVKVRVKSGVAGNTDILEARAKLLEVRQLLEEIWLRAGKA